MPSRTCRRLARDPDPGHRGDEGPYVRAAQLSDTWARMYGKGRVFYTSMGHREDVWENPMYQALLLGRTRLGDRPRRGLSSPISARSPRSTTNCRSKCDCTCKAASRRASESQFAHRYRLADYGGEYLDAVDQRHQNTRRKQIFGCDHEQVAVDDRHVGSEPGLERADAILSETSEGCAAVNPRSVSSRESRCSGCHPAGGFPEASWRVTPA